MKYVKPNLIAVCLLTLLCFAGKSASSVNPTTFKAWYVIAFCLISGICLGLIIGANPNNLFNLFFNKRKTVDLANDVIFKTNANYFKGIDSVGGQVVLTEQFFAFIPHNFNLQHPEIKVTLSNIKSFKPLNIFNSRSPNGIYIIDNDDRALSFAIGNYAAFTNTINTLAKLQLHI
jgi:hypothetical protein